MDSLNPQGIDQRFDICYRRKRMRGISDVTSSEGLAIPAQDSKSRDGGVHKLSSETCLLEPPSLESSDHSSGETGRQIHMPVDDGDGEDTRNSTYVSHGLISVVGRRRVMEDALAVAKFDSYQFFAVYDGHGGILVANACRDRLHQLVEEEVEEWRLSGEEVLNWEKVMTVSFSKMDQEVGGGQGEVEPETGEETTNTNTNTNKNTTGSTAVVVLVGEEDIVVANCGDSRAVLWRGGAAVPLSRDHKPDRPDEIERIEAAGGRIINWNGFRVLGVLATSRSIGDHYLKPYVIPEPEVTVSKRTVSDGFIVMATDGLWDVVSNEFACEVVRRCLDGQINRRFREGFSGSAAAATMLAELAMARGSEDNISVIVVELNK